MLRLIIRSGLACVPVVFHQNNYKMEKTTENAENIKIVSGQGHGSAVESVNKTAVACEEAAKIRNNDSSPTYMHLEEHTLSSITGWDRLKNIFCLSESNEVNPNMVFVIHLANSGMVFGFLLGGMREYVKAFNHFMLTNDTTKFMNTRDAQAQLARAGFKAFLKGGIITAPKVGFLTGLFLLVQTAISEYRGKNGIIEFPIAGAVTTAIMKWNLGIRGMISGCFTGAISGILIGPPLYLLLKLNGLTISDAKYMLLSIQKRREEMTLEMRKRNTNNMSEWERVYNEKTKHLPSGLTD